MEAAPLAPIQVSASRNPGWASTLACKIRTGASSAKTSGTAICTGLNTPMDKTARKNPPRKGSLPPKGTGPGGGNRPLPAKPYLLRPLPDCRERGAPAAGTPHHPHCQPLPGLPPLGQLAGPSQPQGENPAQRPLAGERAGQNAPYPRRFRAALWQHPQIVPIKIPHCRCLWGIFCGILLTHNVPCGTIYIKQRRRGCEFGRMAGAD